MQSENGLLVDVGQIHQVVENADVFAVGFSNFAERLLVDARSGSEIGPMVRVVEPLASIQERFFWLGKERPQFGVPQAFVFFAWPHSITFLEQSGLWRRIRDRVRADSDPKAGRQCSVTLQRLRALERQVLVAAVKGENFVSLWPQEQQGDTR